MEALANSLSSLNTTQSSALRTYIDSQANNDALQTAVKKIRTDALKNKDLRKILGIRGGFGFGSLRNMPQRLSQMNAQILKSPAFLKAFNSQFPGSSSGTSAIGLPSPTQATPDGRPIPVGGTSVAQGGSSPTNTPFINYISSNTPFTNNFDTTRRNSWSGEPSRQSTWGNGVSFS